MAAVLRHFAQFAPPTHKKRVEHLLTEQLPGLLAGLIRTAWEAASEIMVLLCDLSAPPHEQIWMALEEGLGPLFAQPQIGDNGVVVDAIRHLPTIYSPWLASGPGGVVKDILAQLDRVTDRFRTKAQSNGIERTWDQIEQAGPAFREWLLLLEQPLLAAQPDAATIVERLTPPQEVLRRIRGETRSNRADNWDTELATLLSGRYAYCTPVKSRPYGDFGDHLRIYRTTWNGEDIQLKVYRFDLAHHRPSMVRLLDYLWQNERRALQNLTSHRAGRGLVRFRFVDSDFESKGIRILATEPTGDLTLQRAMETHRHLFHDHEKLWREIHSLVEAVAAMHRLNHLHRAIRPENIFVKLDPDNRDYHFKLANFEWSIDLHEIRGQHLENNCLDYYYAPEVLAPIFRRESRTRGVSFAADIYSLGLTLYELLVERFLHGELKKFRNAEDYDPLAHRDWLAQLRANVDRKFHDSNVMRLMLRTMLQAESHLRYPNVDHVAEDIAQCATEASRVHMLLHDPEHPPLMITTSSGGPESPTSIAHFLQKLRPDMHWHGNLDQFLQHELNGAQVYASAGTSTLYFKGKKFEFVADRFTYHTDPSKKDAPRPLDVPFFRVAGPRDRREGPLLATLGQVEVEPVERIHARLKGEHLQFVARSEVWRLLFALAEESRERGDQTQRQFYSVLTLTSDAEEALWRRQVIPYDLVSSSIDGKSMTVRIKANRLARRVADEELEPLDRFTARQVAREDPYFELVKSDNPLTTSDEGLPWLYVGGESETGEVELRRQQVFPPPLKFGNIRPLSLAGSRAVYQRRQDLLRILEDDSYVLRAVTELNKVRTKEPYRALTSDQFFDKTLDAAKQRIVNRVLAEPPLFLVQGPPGTGKTTLAAEVVRQTLSKHPSARILVVSQAHDPLNNLLLRVHEAYNGKQDRVRSARSATRDGAGLEQPTLVRLVSGNRIRTRARTDENRKVQEFLPSAAARLVLTKPIPAPRAGSRVTQTLIAKWRAFVEENDRALARSVEQRIVNSANMVFVTANDKSLADLPVDRSFDLLIFEEAARAYPLEILSAMRSARRWLLIGDHQQLSPFALEDFQQELERLMVESTAWSAGTEDRQPYNPEVADFFRFLYEGRGLGEGDQQRPADVLEAQWRMHPEIGDLMRDVYYETMKNGDSKEDEVNLRKKYKHDFDDPPELENQPLIWINTPSVSKNRWAREKPVAGGGYVNPFEVAVIRALVKRLQQKHSLANRLVFLSPYRAQVQLLNRTFQNWKNPTSQATELAGRAYTVDSFQGRQSDIVIVSLVRNNEHANVTNALGFLAQREGRKRTGVMCSRAQRLLIIVGCRSHFARFLNDRDASHLAEVSAFIDKGIQGNSLLTGVDDDFLRQRFKEDLDLDMDVKEELDLDQDD
jgi:serine/threonine protein kinase